MITNALEGSTSITGKPTSTVSAICNQSVKSPPVAWVRNSFQLMVGIGTLLAGLAAWFLWYRWRRGSLPRTKWFYRLVVAAGPLSLVALISGWIVTEVGRQPWIVQGYMKTSEAVTEASGIWFSFGLVLLLYAVIGTTAIMVLRGMSRRWREGDGADEEVASPYGPSTASGPPAASGSAGA